MIDRYAIYSDVKDINAKYGLTGETLIAPNYNASPSQQLPILLNAKQSEITFCYWGTSQQWSNNKRISPKLLTAERDKLLLKTTLKTAFKNRRCIVPVNGFYQWKQYSKKRKTAYYFHNQKELLLSLPALWEENVDMEGNTYLTFKIIEVPNYISFPEFGALMPTILPQDAEAKWLDSYSTTDELMTLLQAKDGLNQITFHAVSHHIANKSHNHQGLIQAQPQVDQLGNYTLFE